jgi:hypothetical protein
VVEARPAARRAGYSPLSSTDLDPPLAVVPVRVVDS